MSPPAASPALETDPRVPFENNLVLSVTVQCLTYRQEDTMFEWCQKFNSDVTISRPIFIIGATTSPLNAFIPYGLYASILKYRGRT